MYHHNTLQYGAKPTCIQNQNSAQRTNAVQAAVYTSNTRKKISTNITVEAKYTSCTFASQNLNLVQAKGVLP
jgi:mRNA-degrading endonuclease toxin of MazEF toxin-antitoxin module